MQATRINYDMLTYLPAEIDTVEGQNILMDEFGKGAFSFVVVEGMADKDISALRRMQLYIDYAADIYAIYLNYFSPDDIHVYSIDESFLDVTHYREP